MGWKHKKKRMSWMYNKKKRGLGRDLGLVFLMILKTLTQTKANANELYATLKQSLYLKKQSNFPILNFL
jgi:hypothetical protein